MSLTYIAPVDEIGFLLKNVVKLCDLPASTLTETSPDLLDAVLDEAKKLAGQVIAPTNRIGDEEGVHLDSDGDVQCPQSFIAAYQEYIAGGWAGLPFPEQFGGQGLPFTLSVAVQEMWHSANMAWGLCPLLSQGAMEAILINASDELKQTYLPPMIEGSWTGTMNLTEPDSGSDLSNIKTKAVFSEAHNAYLLSGQKIFITWGDHQMADNIVHLVLARLPDAPAGVKGISLFLVPKYLPDANGDFTLKNDCRAFSLEKKMGIHASPTCVMSFGDQGGAVGYLVGELNRGLACMFTMMNNARLTVGLQGVSLCEAAYQQAVAYSFERKQGRAPGGQQSDLIVKHPDVQRMLMSMRALTEAGRTLAYIGCSQLDLAETAQTAEERARYKRRAALLTPIIKSWCTEAAQEVTSLNIQCHGGMGFIEETGAAQLARDARILPIYEGTNGIQALDLVGRKITADKGLALEELIADLEQMLADIKLDSVVDSSLLEDAKNAVALLTEVKSWVLSAGELEVSGKAHEVLMLLGTVIAGCYSLLACHESQLSQELAPAFKQSKKITTEFYLRNILPRIASCQVIVFKHQFEYLEDAEEYFNL